MTKKGMNTHILKHYRTLGLRLILCKVPIIGMN